VLIRSSTVPPLVSASLLPNTVIPAAGCGAARPPAVSRTASPLRILLATTQRAGAARVAMAFARAGCHVEALCWHRDLLAHTRAVRRLHRYNPVRPLAALSRAIAAAAPDLVVPCDDRAVVHLQALQARLVAAGAHDRAAVIARSIGDPAAAERATEGRAAFAARARDAGVRAPLTLAVGDLAGLRAAIGEVGLPAMLKVDGTWGGAGIARADTLAEAERLFLALSVGPGAARTLKRLVADRNPFALMPWLCGARPRVNVQAFVAGRPANCVLSCRDGEVLAIIQAEVVCAAHPMAPAAIVRIVDHPEIAAAARRIAASCRLSGFCGLDFMIDAAGAAHLIEMNPRITPLGPLVFDRGRDPVGAWVAAHAGWHAPPPCAPTTDADLVAFFPQAWWLDPRSPELTAAYHDVPWSEPDLVRALVRLAHGGQGRLARLLGAVVRRAASQNGVRWDPPPACPGDDIGVRSRDIVTHDA